MQYLPLIAGFLLFFPFSTYAETIDLVCTDATGFSVNYDIDTSRNIVLMSGKAASNVSIHRDSIMFVLNFQGQEWSHTINRGTGNMTVQAQDKTILPVYKCEKAKSKF